MRPDTPRPSRPAPPDVAELRALREAHPELAPAIDLQIELVTLQRRLQARVPTPVSPLTAAVAGSRLAGGHRLLELSEVSLDWSDFRLAVRQTADILRRHDSMDAADHARIVELAREAPAIEAHLLAWYRESAVPPAERSGLAAEKRNAPAMLDQVFTLALRPFLARAVDVASQGVKLDTWRHPWCPFCGWEAEFAILTPEARLLTCGRCEGRWEWDEVGCPWCETRDRARLVTFASPDRRYRVYACNSCRRYLKAYDTRGASRPALPAVDTIATLPLDAAAIQRGYGN